MAGFRGVVPSRETVELILGNLARSQQALAEEVLAGVDPFATDDKGSMRLVDKVHVNAALGGIFAGLLDGTVVPNAPALG